MWALSLWTVAVANVAWADAPADPSTVSAPTMWLAQEDEELMEPTVLPDAEATEEGTDDAEAPADDETAPTEEEADAQQQAPTPPSPEGDDPYPPPADAVGRMPTVNGPSGLLRLATADGLPVDTFALGLFGEFFTANDVVRAGDENVRFLGRLTLSWRAHEILEAFASLSGRGNVNNYAQPELIQSQGDMTLGAKAFREIDRGLSLGGILGLSFLNGQDSVGFDFSATSLDFRGLFEYSLARAQGVPFVVVLNAGFFLDNSPELFAAEGSSVFELQRVERFAHQVSAYDLVQLGLGFEVPVEYVSPSLEWSLGVPVGGEDVLDCAGSPIPCVSDAGFAAFPNIITVGLKASPLPLLALNLGVDISLTSEEALGLPTTAPYNVAFGISYNLDPTPPEAPAIAAATEETPQPSGPTGWILGEVVDDASGEPIAGATVVYANSDLTPQSTRSDTGRFRSYEFPVGTQVSVEVSHPRYETRSFTRTIEPGEDGIRIRLQPGSSTAMIAGRVVDATGDPIPATIYVTGPQDLEVDADPMTAEFGQDLEQGRYIVTVVADGFTSDRQSVEIGAGQTEHNVTLSPLPDGQAAVLRGDRIDLSGERIEFEDDELTPASQELLDQVASLMDEFPDLQLRVVAHSADDGNVRDTERQAEAVVDYLVSAGVSASRLDAEGAGGERPLFPNINNRNRERNRRVELRFGD